MGILIGLMPCSYPEGSDFNYCTDEKPDRIHFALDVLYNGAFDPQSPSWKIEPYQNFTVTIPSHLTGTAQIHIAQAYCAMASGHPTKLVLRLVRCTV